MSDTHRWNITRRDGDTIYVCEGDHERSAGCVEVAYVREGPKSGGAPTMAPTGCAEGHDSGTEIERLRNALESIAEYWNGLENETAMRDACYHAVRTARAALESELPERGTPRLHPVQRLRRLLERVLNETRHGNFVITGTLASDIRAALRDTADVNATDESTRWPSIVADPTVPEGEIRVVHSGWTCGCGAHNTGGETCVRCKVKPDAGWLELHRGGNG